MTHQLDLEILGMHCAACTRNVVRAISSAAGVAEENVNTAAEKAQITLVPTRIETRERVKKIR